MASTVREQILAAFFTALKALEGTVYKLTAQRDRDTEVSEYPALVLLAGEQSADDSFATGVTRYVLTVTVEGYVQETDDGKTTAEKIDELYGKVLQAALSDRTLGGLAVDVREQPLEQQIDRSAGHPPGGAFSLPFEIEYWTRQGDPFTVGP
jgi:hypothetical protein